MRLLLLALALSGCESPRPTALAAVSTPPDSVRYQSLEGTPHAVATVWSHGVVNLSMPLRVLVYDRNTPCLERLTVTWRAAHVAGSIAGLVCTSSNPAAGVDGSLEGTLTTDTMTVLARATVSTDCGMAEIETPAKLVRQ